jgi:hypothetical protein
MKARQGKKRLTGKARESKAKQYKARQSSQAREGKAHKQSS